MGGASLFSRRERFAVVGSTNDVVRDWLTAGTPEVCLAVADEQTAGRGREGRRWIAPPGAALLLSLGFRPTWLAPERTWRLAALVSMAMADAAEDEAGTPARTVRLKWPNDLVVEGPDGIRKLAGLLGESDGLGSADPRVVVGIGVNVDWAAADFPPDLAADMTSLREMAGRAVTRDRLLDAFAARLEPRIEALRAGDFDADGFAARQLVAGRDVRLELPDGRSREVRALGVDGESGALLVEDHASLGGVAAVYSGEIRHLRLAEPALPGTV